MAKLHCLFCLLFLMLSFQLIMAQEYRGGVSTEVEITRNLNAEIGFEARKVFNPESYFNKTFQGKVEYSFADLWRVATSYSYSFITEQEDDGEETGEETSDKSKITADLIFQPRRFNNDLKLVNRFRYHYSTVDDSRAKEYLKNKLTLDYRIHKNMNTYVAVEPFYHLQSRRISHLRIYLGTEMPVLRTKMEIYYIAEVKFKEESFRTFYIVGASFKINYKKGNK
jgi:hypothetical protein